MSISVIPTEKISVVIPVLNEEENIDHMVQSIHSTLSEWDYEMIFVDDGSADKTLSNLINLGKIYPRLRCLSHNATCGQSAALRTGILKANGSIIATLDGDGQNPPHELKNLVLHLLQHPEKVALVQGQRENRKDTLWKIVGSKFANGLRQKLLKDGIRDSGCGLKAFYREAYLSLAYFDHLHRFMPAMIIREGYKVDVLPVAHNERKAGISKYGNLDRALVGALDLLGVIWLLRRRRISKFDEIILRDDKSVQKILNFDKQLSKVL